MRFLAVDVGGTSTRATVVRDDGTCVGYGRAGSGNPTASGTDTSAAAIVRAARDATAQAGCSPADLAGGVIAIAGAGGETGEQLLAEIAKAGLSDDLALDADLLAMYHSGSLSDDGYGLVAGTGAAAVRIRGAQIEAMSDGLGWLLGDAGSGFWIGHRAVLAATSALDQRGPATVLVDLVASRLGIEVDTRRERHGRVAALGHAIEALYRVRPVELAGFAPLAFEAAARGDDVAIGIVNAAADALATTLAAVVVADISGPLVFGGSILSQQPSVAERVARSFRSAGKPSPVITVTDGLAGAAVLSLRHAGLFVDEAMLARIHVSLDTLR